MKRRLYAVLGGVVLSASVFVLNAHAGTVGSSRNSTPPKPVPEPLSCILLLAGGASLAALRRWKSRKGSSKEENLGNA